MGRQQEALEKIHEARLALINIAGSLSCGPGVGESFKAQAEALDILEQDIKNNFEYTAYLKD